MIKDSENELIPELELSIIPRKLMNVVRVEFMGISLSFRRYLMKNSFIVESDNWDMQEMAIEKFPEFCKCLHKHYRNFNLLKSKKSDAHI